MNFLLLVLALCALGMWVFYRSLRLRSLDEKSQTDLQNLIQPVDVLSFRNLVDPHERTSLRCALSPREFRKIERRRVRVAITYVGAVAFNAAVFIRLGDNLRAMPDPEVHKAGVALSAMALRLRIQALQAQFRLMLSLFIPFTVTADRLIAEYERTGSVVAGCMQPATRNAFAS